MCVIVTPLLSLICSPFPPDPTCPAFVLAITGLEETGFGLNVLGVDAMLA